MKNSSFFDDVSKKCQTSILARFAEFRTFFFAKFAKGWTFGTSWCGGTQIAKSTSFLTIKWGVIFAGFNSNFGSNCLIIISESTCLEIILVTNSNLKFAQKWENHVVSKEISYFSASMYQWQKVLTYDISGTAAGFWKVVGEK